MKKISCSIIIILSIIITSCQWKNPENNPYCPDNRFPEISVEINGNAVTNGFTGHIFPNTYEDYSSDPAVFTIVNTGRDVLEIESIGISNDLDFTLDTEGLAGTLPVNGETEFSITFNPAETGEKSAVVVIKNNDPFLENFSFTVTGTSTLVPAPEIAVKIDGTYVLDAAGSHTFDPVTSGGEGDPVECVIENLGDADLEISGITLNDGTNFNLNDDGMNNVILGGENTSFYITFSPDSEGNKSAVVTIENNDFDEDEYAFEVNGDCIEPEIVVEKDTENIPDGTGSFTFATVEEKSTGETAAFTIRNIGEYELLINDITIDNAADFSLDTSGIDTTIPAGDATTFNITFDPQSSGNRSSSVSILCSDSDESEFTFTVTGFSLEKYIFLAKWGSYGTGNYNFDRPQDIASLEDASGNVYLYVVDNYNRRIIVHNSFGEYVNQWGTYGSGNGQFNNPIGICIAKTGENYFIYVADRYNNSIQKFNSSGAYVTHYAISSPTNVGVKSNGYIYIIQYYIHYITILDVSGNSAGTFGSEGTGDGQFQAPYDVVFDSNGNMFVSEGVGQRVQKFSPDGTPLGWWGKSASNGSGWHPAGTAQAVEYIPADDTDGRGTGDGEFCFPNRLAVDSAGNLYVADNNNNRVQKFDTQGRLVAKWGSAGTGDGQFNVTKGVAVDSYQRVYVADFNNNRIQKFTAEKIKPEVTSSSPAEEADDIDPNNHLITISFNEWMDTSKGTATIEGGSQTLDSPVWSNRNKTVTYTLSGALNTSTTYSIVLTGFTDEAGNELNGVPYITNGKIDFTTASVDTTPPFTLSATPSEGAGVSSTIASISITFNEAMNTGEGTATLGGGAGSTGSGVWSNGNRTVTYPVNGPLDLAADYTVTLVGFKDAAGNSLDGAPVLADGILDFTVDDKVVILSESFETWNSTAPGSFTYFQNVTGESPERNWSSVTNSSYPTISSAYLGTYYAFADCYNWSSGQTANLDQINYMDLSVAGTYTLAFAMTHDKGYPINNDKLEVFVDTGSGFGSAIATISRYDASYTTPGWGVHSVDLSSYSGQQSVKIRLKAVCGYGNNFGIDALQIYRE